MRYPASEKLEIVRLVEQSHLPVRRTLAKLGIQPARFYRWYDRLQTGGPDPRRALGPAATPAALRGRRRDRTRPMLQERQKSSCHGAVRT